MNAALKLYGNSSSKVATSKLSSAKNFNEKNVINYEERKETLNNSSAYVKISAISDITSVDTDIFSKTLEYVFINNVNSVSIGKTKGLKKVGAFAMSLHFPMSMKLYAAEMRESVQDGLILKLALSGLLATILNSLNINTVQLTNGLIVLAVLAVLDSILSLIPGSVKPGTELDHRLQSKFWGFITNLIAFVMGIAAKDFLTTLVPNPNFIQKYTFVSLPYLIIFYLFLIYLFRCAKYVANVNNTKLPPFITKYFQEEEKSPETNEV